MQTRRKFITTATGVTVASAIPAFAHANTDPLFSFGLMADCQYADVAVRGNRFYRQSPEKLKAAIEIFNQHDLAFTFHLGDFIDRDFASFDTLAPIAAKLKSHLYHALGNHDFDVDDKDKGNVVEKLGIEGPGYYSFSKAGFRFIVIDSTDVSTYRHPAGSIENLTAIAELKKHKQAKVAGSQQWNGRPSDRQIEWLKVEFKSAATANEKVMLMGHHPILPNESHAIWNAQSLSQLLQNQNCVKLYINGHNHAGHYIDHNGFHYLTLNGMLETLNRNAFSIAHVFADRLEIEGFERQSSHTLKFRGD